MSMNNFFVKEALGKGSYGEVKRVVRKSDNKSYAMKCVDISRMDAKEISDTMNEVCSSNLYVQSVLPK